MANSFIRAFAIMLALTGFSATTYTGGAPTGGSGSHTAMDDNGPGVGTSSPMCLPSDPSHCGLQ